MAINNDDAYLSLLSEYKNRLKGMKTLYDRLTAFVNILDNWSHEEENALMDRVLVDLMNCASLFPKEDNKKLFFQFALERHSLKMVRLIEASPLNKHEFRSALWSALHYLAESVYETNDGFLFGKQLTLNLMDYFLEDPERNYADELGYTYFHAACMSGNATAVNVFLSQGVDVNLDSYKYSALHIAVQYRREEIVEILLRHGADANKLDVEKSTPLHALTRLCLCLCTNGIRFCDYRLPVDKIVQMLVDHGAIMETRNRDGNSPLDLAVSRFDVQLVKSLLKHGASLDSLNEDKMFSTEFTSTELKNYPLALNLIEMIQFLQSVGYEMNFCSRLRMIKCFMRVRGNDTDHLIPELAGGFKSTRTTLAMLENLMVYKRFGFYMNPEATDFFRQKCEKIQSILPINEFICYPKKKHRIWTKEVRKIKNIMLNNDVSLYQLCQMSYSEGYSIIKNLNNCQLPPMDDISCTAINLIVKRHLANILIRSQLELFVTNLFMTDNCNLNLPYVIIRLVAEHMSYEELVRLYEQVYNDVYPWWNDSWKRFKLKHMNDVYMFLSINLSCILYRAFTNRQAALNDL